MTNPIATGSPAERVSAPARPHIDPTTKLTNGLGRSGKIILAGIALVFLACGSPKPDTSGGAAGGQASSSGAAAADTGPGASKDSPAPVGTDVTAAKDWHLTVTAPAADVTADIVKANQFNKPQVAGHKLYAVPVKIHNGSDKPGIALVEMKLGALPPNGVRVDQVFSTAGYPTLDASAQMQPGATLEGRMVFELDPATFPQTVLLAEPQFTLDTNADQRFLALS